MNKKILVILALLIAILIPALYYRVSGGEASYTKKHTIDKADVVFKFTKSVSKSLLGEEYNFIYFDYYIKNKSNQRLYFHPGKIRVRYNGVNNSSTEYDSIASALTEPIEINNNNSIFHLYLVFKEKKIALKPDEFIVINAGINQTKGDQHGKSEIR